MSFLQSLTTWSIYIFVFSHSLKSFTDWILWKACLTIGRWIFQQLFKKGTIQRLATERNSKSVSGWAKKTKNKTTQTSSEDRHRFSEKGPTLHLVFRLNLRPFQSRLAVRVRARGGKKSGGWVGGIERAQRQVINGGSAHGAASRVGAFVRGGRGRCLLRPTPPTHDTPVCANRDNDRPTWRVSVSECVRACVCVSVCRYGYRRRRRENAAKGPLLFFFFFWRARTCQVSPWNGAETEGPIGDGPRLFRSEPRRPIDGPVLRMPSIAQVGRVEPLIRPGAAPCSLFYFAHRRFQGADQSGAATVSHLDWMRPIQWSFLLRFVVFLLWLVLV